VKFGQLSACFNNGRLASLRSPPFSAAAAAAAVSDEQRSATLSFTHVAATTAAVQASEVDLEPLHDARASLRAWRLRWLWPTGLSVGLLISIRSQAAFPVRPGDAGPGQIKAEAYIESGKRGKERRQSEGSPQRPSVAGRPSSHRPIHPSIHSS